MLDLQLHCRNSDFEFLYVPLHGSEVGRASGGITAPAGNAGTDIKNSDTFISGKMEVTRTPKDNDSRWKERYVCIRDFWEDQSKGQVQRQAGKGRKDKEGEEGKERSEEDIVNSSVHDIKLLYEEMAWASLGPALGQECWRAMTAP